MNSATGPTTCRRHALTLPVVHTWHPRRRLGLTAPRRCCLQGNTGNANAGEGNTGLANQGQGNTGCSLSGQGQTGSNC